MSPDEHAMVPIAVRNYSLEYMPSVDKQVGAMNVLAQVDHADADDEIVEAAPVGRRGRLPLPPCKEPPPTETCLVSV